MLTTRTNSDALRKIDRSISESIICPNTNLNRLPSAGGTEMIHNYEWFIGGVFVGAIVVVLMTLFSRVLKGS